MGKEENVCNKLLNKFDFLKENCKIIRERRISIDIKNDSYLDVIDFLKNSLGFIQLCTITGLDNYEDFQVIYHIANDEGIIVNLKLSVSKSKPVIKTVTKIFEGATFYERELKDLFGIEVEGLPKGRRYPLPDGWPEGQYPLRKDWKSNTSCIDLKTGESSIDKGGK